MNQVLSERRQRKEIPPSNNYQDGYYKKLERFQGFTIGGEGSFERGSINIQRDRFGLVCAGKNATLYDIQGGNSVDLFQQKVVDSSVNQGIFLSGPSQTQLFTLLACEDQTARVFSFNQDQGQCKLQYDATGHQLSVNSVSRTSLSDYVLLGSKDCHWSMHNIIKGARIFKASASCGIDLIRSHPDGLVVITADDNGLLKLWDIRSQELIVAIDECKGMKFKGLDFSAKGIHFAGSVVNGDGQGELMIWDIRAFNSPNSSNNARKIDLDGKRSCQTSRFDQSGKLLALSHDKGIDLIKTKGWKKLATVNENQFILDTCSSGEYLGCLSQSGVVNFYKGS